LAENIIKVCGAGAAKRRGACGLFEDQRSINLEEPVRAVSESGFQPNRTRLNSTGLRRPFFAYRELQMPKPSAIPSDYDFAKAYDELKRLREDVAWMEKSFASKRTAGEPVDSASKPAGRAGS
jgi:hypothetical protein